MSGAVVVAGAADRLSFAVFLALVVHLIVVLGVVFEQEDLAPLPNTMEITLAQFDDEVKPEKADFLAQSNQQGSGTLEEKSELASPEKAEYRDNVIKKTDRVQQVASSRPEPVVKEKTVISSTSKAPRKVQEVIKKKTPLPDPAKKTKKSLLARSFEIASLEAKYQRQRKEYSKRPRVTRLNAASTMKAADAQYVNQVISKIERIGTLNFPEEARSKVYGRPRLLIAIWTDGSLKEMRVLQSSGNNLLDDKAMKIVRLAAPFAPFPEKMRNDSDVVELIRTLEFTGE